MPPEFAFISFDRPDGAWTYEEEENIDLSGTEEPSAHTAVVPVLQVNENNIKHQGNIGAS